MSMLFGSAAIGGARVSLSNTTVSDSTVSPTNANARYKLEADGDIIRTLVNGGATDLGDWISPKAFAGSNYECRSTVTSGSLSVDPSAGSWISLGSDREWSRQQSTTGTSQGIFTLEIRHSVSLVVLATATIQLDAEKTI